MKDIVILFVPVGQEPQVIAVENSLEAFQAVVEGPIELLPLDTHIDLVCNENGKLEKLPPNRDFFEDVIVGHFFITRSNDDGENISLTPEDIYTWKAAFTMKRDHN